MPTPTPAAATPPSNTEAPIEIGPEDESDTGYESSLAESSTYTVSSSVLDYVFENGRRYPSARNRTTEAFLPNDEVEQERLDLLHFCHTLILNGELFLAPLDEQQLKGKRILDLGTGTGLWAIDVGDRFPEAEVLGVDQSPIQPDFVPPNVRFEVDNIEDEWTYTTPFTLIHGRSLMGSIKDWPSLIKRAYNHLEPSGYLDLHEIQAVGGYSEDNSHLGTGCAIFCDALREAGIKAGTRLDLAPALAGMMRDAGFVDIEVKVFKVPLGTWAKDARYKQLGALTLQSNVSGAEAYGLAAFTKVLGWSVERAREVCAGHVRDGGDKKVHVIYPVYNVVGRKPAVGEVVG